jgi:hypothetical protein
MATKIEYVNDEQRTMKVTVTCPLCLTEQRPLLVSIERYNAWKNGELFIHDAFPELTASERELLMTGTCDPCWDRMYDNA